MKRLLFLAALMATPAHADETAIDGTWKGTSICQAKRSACHDETIVFRARQTGPDSHRIRTYRLVAGQEVYMGEMIGTYTGATTFRAQSVTRSRHMATWTFTLSGDHMSGDATLSDGMIYRKVEADRAK